MVEMDSTDGQKVSKASRTMRKRTYRLMRNSSEMAVDDLHFFHKSSLGYRPRSRKRARRCKLISRNETDAGADDEQEIFERDYKLNDSEQELFVSTRLVKQLHLQTEIRNSPKQNRLQLSKPKSTCSPKTIRKCPSGENLSSQRRHSTGTPLKNNVNPFWLGKPPLEPEPQPTLKSGKTSADESVVESSESTVYGFFSDSELHESMKRNRRFPIGHVEYQGDDEESESELVRKPLSARNRSYLKQHNVKKRAVRKTSVPKGQIFDDDVEMQ